VCAFSAAVATAYFVYRVITYLGIAEREGTALLRTKILIVTSSVVLAAVVYLGFVALIRLWIVSRAIGKIMREFPIHIQPLHPDGCGGLGSLSHAQAHAVYCCCTCRRWPEPDHRLARNPYSFKSSSRAVRTDWSLLTPVSLGIRQPSLAASSDLEKNRDLTLKPVARVFDAKIKAMRPSKTDEAQQLKAKADSLAEIKRQLELLDEACPIWPLHTKRLRIVLVTAVLPVVVPIVTAIIAHLLDRQK
jgi:hypothetical protein